MAPPSRETLTRVRCPFCSRQTRCSAPNKWGTLFIDQDDRATPKARGKTVDAPEDPECRKRCEREGGPVNESRAILMGEDRKKRPCDCNARRKVTLRRGEGVSGSSCFQEEPAGN